MQLNTRTVLGQFGNDRYRSRDIQSGQFTGGLGNHVNPEQDVGARPRSFAG